MSLLRKSPEQIRLIAIGCYIAGVAISIINLCFSYRFFANSFGIRNTLTELAAWGLAVLIALYETALTTIFTTPDELGLSFAPPRLNLPPSFPQWAPTALKMALIATACLITWWVYSMDWRSTASALGIQNPEAANFACFCLVFGSEVLSILGYGLWALGAAGKANTQPFWSAVNQLIRQENSAGKQSPLQPSSTEKVSDRLRNLAKQSKDKG